MSIVGSIFARVSGPVVTAFHGEDVVRWPAGVEADALTVEDAIWQTADEQNDGSINPQQTFTGTLALLSETVIATGDVWVIHGETYRVQRVCEVDPANDRRDLQLVRAERSVTRHVGGAVTLVRGIR